MDQPLNDGATDFELPPPITYYDEDGIGGLEMWLAPKPTVDRVWHYTDSAGALGIVHSGQLWASSILALNDTEEYLYGVKLLFDLVQKVSDSRRIPTPQKDFIQEVALLVAGSMPYRRFFVCCASEDSDSLSQWRGYGGGVGYAVGIDVTEDGALDVLDETVPKRRPSRSEMNGMDGTFLSWAKVLYEPNEQEALLLQGLSLLANTPDELIGVGMMHPGSAAGVLSALTLLCKHPSFRDEREVRMIASVPEGHPAVQFRPGRFGVTPYVRIVQLPTGVEGVSPMLWRGVARQGRLPIAAVNVGPSPHAESAADGMRQLLVANHLGSIPLGRTDTPYR